LASKDKLLASAQKNLQKGQIPKAIKDYLKLVEMDPKDTRTRQKLAELYSRVHQIDEALQQYEQVAKHYAGQGFYLKAIAVYKQMQKLAPEKADVYFQLAELNKKQGLLGNALAELRTLVALYEKEGNIPETLKVLEAMRELDPDNLNIRVKVAEIYAKNNLNEKALAELSELSTALQTAGDSDRLLKLYEIFLPLYPKNPEIKLGAADALIRKGHGDKALSLLQGLLPDHPDKPEVLKLLAAAYRTKRDSENELLTYKHLLKLQPKDLDLRENFLRACLDQKTETDKVLENLDSWQADFSAAGRDETLREFCRILQETVPGDRRLEGLIARLGFVSPGLAEDHAVKSAPVEARPVSAALEGPAAESAPEISTVPEAPIEVAAPAEPGDVSIEDENHPAQEAEEIPLDFLESVGTGEPSAPPDKFEAGEPEVLPEPEMPEAEEPMELPPTGLAVESEPEERAPAESGPVADEDSLTASPEDEGDLVEMEIELEFEGEEPSSLSATFSPEESDDEIEEATVLDRDEIGDSFFATGSDDESAPGSEEEIDGNSVEETPGADEGEPEETIYLDLNEAIPEEAPEQVEALLEELEEIAEELPEEEGDLDLEELEEIVELEPGEAVGTVAEEIVEDLVELETAAVLEEEPEPPEWAEDLEEVEFYQRQGLLDDAERVCRELMRQFPGESEIEEKLAGVLQTRHELTTREPAAAEEFFDLGTEVIEEIEEEVGDFLEETAPQEEDSFSLDGIFSDSQKGVRTEIEAEDTESHYNLGIAYKEMGLLDEAIAEFDQALGSPQRRIDCLTLKGLCFAQQGNLAEAEEALRTALAEPGLPPDKEINLNFELGLLYESGERYEEALNCYRLVSDRDHFFREVGERIDRLQPLLGKEGQDKTDGSDPKDKRDRISYV